jgi:hypothetical protein
MLTFLEEIRNRNEILFWFGTVCFVFVLVCLFLMRATDIRVMGINAWIKPLKFSLSTVFYCGAMAWYMHYLPDSGFVKPFSWAIVWLLGFEIVYIAIQAGRGELSHFNLSSGFYSAMYSMMALAATLVTIGTAYIGILFFTGSFPDLPNLYLWSIRLGIFIFVIFSFEGFVMGSKLTHTIGGPDGGSGIPFLNWSTKFGDPRIAHFVGMHALQVLPLLGFYVFRSVPSVCIVAILYGLLSVQLLLQALAGKPFISGQ